ncbi:MAG: Chaperone protein DnaJ [Wolbachia endosymbiont of Ctenocephalides orientis wCori]|nr:MAG: Chaperone protein DnaJ [Wolbachia endosymbiont of Ctenocephalides orientis wCori]
MNYYKILEISPEATSDEVKKAYQTLILKNHPDKFPPQKRETYNKLSEKKRKGDLLSESELKESQDLIMPFLKIQKAYKLLSDPEKRKRYDESGYQENTVKLDDLFEEYIRKEHMVFCINCHLSFVDDSEISAIAAFQKEWPQAH